MIELFPHQDDFLYSNAIHTGLVGGFGCGKSFIGTLKVVSKKMQYPSINVAYYLPTYKLIKDIAYENISEALERQNIKYTLNRSDAEFLTPIGKIIMRSMERPDNIVGYEVGYSLVDEADIPPKEKMQNAFKNIIARNRKKLPDGLPNSTDFVSTPEGFRFLYDFFVKKPSPSKILIKGKTESNKALPESYIETLKESYTEEQLAAYLNGEFVNLTSGTVYHAFDRKINHSDRQIRKGDVLNVGMDFNITNMSAVIHVVDGRDIHAVGEITKAYDTADMIRIINERYKGHKIVVHPDASGNSRNTAGDSDIKLLKKARFTIRSGKSNPSVRDRITTVNAAFKNAKGETSYFVNTNTCPEYTEALEKMPYKNGLPDKDSGFDHVTDAGGYCLYNVKKGIGSTAIYV